MFCFVIMGEYKLTLWAVQIVFELKLADLIQ